MRISDTWSLSAIFWKLVEFIALTCFLLCLGVMFLQVVSRDVFRTAVPWTDEAARYAFIVSIFMGAAVCHRSGTHLRVDLVVAAIPQRLRRWVEILEEMIVALIAAAVCAGAIMMTARSTTVTAAALPITLSWLYAFQALGIGLVSLLAVRRAVDRFRRSGEGAAR